VTIDGPQRPPAESPAAVPEVVPGPATAETATATAEPTTATAETATATGGTRRPPARTRKPPHPNRWIIEWVILLVIAVGFAFIFRTFVVQTFSIPSPSMAPTLQVGDRIVVNKLSYDLHGVHRGDIVVFKRPPLEDQNYADLVKRVIGLPGETISSNDGKVYINCAPLDHPDFANCAPLDEPWLPPGPQSYTGALPVDVNPEFNLPGPVHIPEGEYFVMGDNRTYSQDSRWFGPIPKSLIVGRAFIRVWPFSRIGGI